MTSSVRLASWLLFVVAGTAAGSTCGDGKGSYCGSAFSHFHCPGTCCHDDFNAWCCPAGPWKCNGVFTSGSHCDKTDCCTCTDEVAYITKVHAAGSPKVKAAPAWNLTECCGSESPTTCGWGSGTQIKWTHSQSVSWSESISSTQSVTIKESLLVEGLEVSISLSESYTNGQSRTDTLEQTISSPCTGTYNKTNFLHFSASVQVYEVPVTLTYSQCGKEGTTSGTVMSTVLDGQYNCAETNCKTTKCSTLHGCDHDSLVV